MRKWLYLMLVLAVLYALTKITGKRQRARFPFLRRIDRAITIVVWIMLAIYLTAFVYWLYTQVIH